MFDIGKQAIGAGDVRVAPASSPNATWISAAQASATGRATFLDAERVWRPVLGRGFSRAEGPGNARAEE